MTSIIYDPEKKTAEYKGESIDFYCGPELTENATHVLSIFFRITSPQIALVDRIGICFYCEKAKT